MKIRWSAVTSVPHKEIWQSIWFQVPCYIKTSLSQIKLSVLFLFLQEFSSFSFICTWLCLCWRYLKKNSLILLHMYLNNNPTGITLHPWWLLNAFSNVFPVTQNSTNAYYSRKQFLRSIILAISLSVFIDTNKR